MEVTCTRCHQTVESENRYCPACGLPQLTYTSDGSPEEFQAEPGLEVVRDADSVDWKQALRAALMLAVPAGVLSSGPSPVSPLGLLWMASAAGWAVLLYLRSQRPAWITIGAGARIGLVTGLLGAWLAFSISGSALFVERFVLHQSSQIDAEWKTRIATSQQLTQQWADQMTSSDAAQAQAARAQIQAMMLSPAGHAGIEAFGFATNSFFLMLFAVAGGALGARLSVRTRNPQL
jgi:hypothetical protein